MKHNLLAWPVCVGFTAALVAVPLTSVHAATAGAAQKPHAIKRKSHAKTHGAPADEYFGRQKLSILGVRNTVHDLNIRYDGSVQRASMVISVGSNLEDSMHMWSMHYPGDLWLAHNAFQLVQIYMRVPTPEGRAHLKTMSDWLIHQYPHTYYERYLSHIRAIAIAKANATPFPIALGSVQAVPPKQLLASPKPVPTGSAAAVATPVVSKSPLPLQRPSPQSSHSPQPQLSHSPASESSDPT